VAAVVLGESLLDFSHSSRKRVRPHQARVALHAVREPMPVLPLASVQLAKGGREVAEESPDQGSHIILAQHGREFGKCFVGWRRRRHQGRKANRSDFFRKRKRRRKTPTPHAVPPQYSRTPDLPRRGFSGKRRSGGDG